MGLLKSIAKGIGGIVGEVSGQSAQIDAQKAAALKEQEFQMGIQQKTWDREDDAVQRRVADLKAGGLSPTLAAGGAAQVSQPTAGMAAGAAAGRAAGASKEMKVGKGLQMAAEYQRYTSTFLDNKIKAESLKGMKWENQAKAMPAQKLVGGEYVDAGHNMAIQTALEEMKGKAWSNEKISREISNLKQQNKDWQYRNILNEMKRSWKYKGMTHNELQTVALSAVAVGREQQNRLRRKDIKFYDKRGYSPAQYHALMGMAQKSIGVVPGVGRLIR